MCVYVVKVKVKCFKLVNYTLHVALAVLTGLFTDLGDMLKYDILDQRQGVKSQSQILEIGYLCF